MDGGGAGFHGYRRQQLPQTSSDMGMKPPAEMNHQMVTINKHSNSTADDNECMVREQDRFMPIANVIRIMRKILPPHAKISDDAKETIQECVSEYISFVTSEANERCQQEQRKTITAEDVLWAMSKLGFDDYIEPLTLYLHRYREMEGDRGAIRGEPLVKRPGECGAPSTMGMPGFAPPAYHMGHHHPQLPGYFGAQLMGGFFKDVSSNGNANANGSSSDAAVAGSPELPTEMKN